MNFLDLSIEGYDESTQIPERSLDGFWNTEKLSNSNIVYVEFKKTKSKYYDDIIDKAKTLPNYTENNGSHSFTINTIQEYIDNTIFVEYIISKIRKWKNVIILLNGKKFETKTDLWHFKKILEANAGEYSELINPYAFYEYIPKEPLEDLPFPYVLYPDLYGGFFAFKKSRESKDIYFCDCEKQAIQNYIALEKKRQEIFGHQGEKIVLRTDEFPKLIEEITSKNSGNPLSLFKFESKICHKCNGKLPQEEYCSAMYGTAFRRQYGWYIRQRYLEYGIDYMLEGHVNIQKQLILRDKCPQNILKYWDKFILASEQSETNPSSDILYIQAKEARREFEKSIENTVRKEFGFKNVGESWVSETTLANIIKTIYSNYEVKTHYRPKWLEGLELDIYIDAIKLGIEYQGQQHYNPIKHWGGEKQLKKQKEHDSRKARICREKGVTLLTVDFDEPLTEIHIRERLKEKSLI
ncbi:hypothetical protein [Coprococcus sp. AF102-57]|jgi:hypothetical protein|uniref:hypothetical protein n=1 Tax=Coprococcus sp. AF102-57 TaxID=2997946 RepID=UPI0022DEF1B0|nr:hypothetical protein [Coprococcus sp. AF102-57]